VSVAAIIVLTAYLALAWLRGAPTFSRLLEVELWFSFLFSAYLGAMGVFLTEIMPADIRTTGFSFAHSFATAIFGGFTPVVCTYLIHATGNPAAPGVWLASAGACGLGASLLLSPRRVARATADASLAQDLSPSVARPSS
jgi:hypothetical protein